MRHVIDAQDDQLSTLQNWVTTYVACRFKCIHPAYFASKSCDNLIAGR